MEKSQKVARTVIDTLPLVMRQLAAAIRKRENLPGEGNYHLLFLLRERPHNLSELAQKHNVSPPTMSSSVSRLAQRGLIQRRRADHDRRQLVIELTPAGHKVVDEIYCHSRQYIEEILCDLPKADLDCLESGLQILLQAFLQPNAAGSAEIIQEDGQ